MSETETKDKPVTVDSVRDELRNAIFWTVFQGGPWDTKAQQDLRQRACAFAEFGVRAGLMGQEEGNEWLDAVWGRKTLAEVGEKYMDDEEEEDA